MIIFEVAEAASEAEVDLVALAEVASVEAALVEAGK